MNFFNFLKSFDFDISSKSILINSLTGINFDLSIFSSSSSFLIFKLESNLYNFIELKFGLEKSLKLFLSKDLNV